MHIRYDRIIQREDALVQRGQSDNREHEERMSEGELRNLYLPEVFCPPIGALTGEGCVDDSRERLAQVSTSKEQRPT